MDGDLGAFNCLRARLFLLEAERSYTHTHYIYIYIYICIFIQTLCLPRPQRAGMMQVERLRDFHHDVVELPLHLLDASQVATPTFSMSSFTISFI